MEYDSDSDRTLPFEFCTPTVFRQGNYDSALSTRDSIFKSLLKRWNNYSHSKFENLDFAYLFPTGFEIKTAVMSHGVSKASGCIGKITYKIMGNQNPLLVKQLNTLADYAVYSGIGRKTPMGMVKRS